MVWIQLDQMKERVFLLHVYCNWIHFSNFGFVDNCNVLSVVEVAPDEPFEFATPDFGV